MATTLKIVMFRHGRIDPRDEKLLSQGDPHLDLEWVKSELPQKAEVLRGIKFDLCLSGPRKRMVETMQGLEEFGIQEIPAVQYAWDGDDVPRGVPYPRSDMEKRLDARTTYHEGKIYPEGEIDPLKEYMRDIVSLFKYIGYWYGSVTILLVTSGARMIPTEALSRRLGPEDFVDDNAMVNWALDERNKANPVTGEAWAYTFDPDTEKIEEVEIATFKS